MPMTIVGIDISMGATGVVVIRGGLKCPTELVSSHVCSAPDPDGTGTDKGMRLHELGSAIESAIGARRIEGTFVEGYSFGSPHAARRIAETHGAVFAMLWRVYRQMPVYVSPMTAKKAACPMHPGFSKDNWARAGKTGKWKRSMPDKADVIRGVYREFGVSLATDAEADAFSVAIAGLRANPRLFPVETTGKVRDLRKVR